MTLYAAKKQTGVLHMSNPLDFQRFSNFVGAIVDRKVRAVAMGITSSTGYFKTLLAQALAAATTAQTGATNASTSAGAADASATAATIVYNNFTSQYLGYLASDPQRTITGNIPNAGAFYIRSTDKHFRVATSVVGGVVTWADATVAADPASVVVAGAANFLSRTVNDAAPQTVAGKVTFQNILLVPRVTDWSSQQAATAVDVQGMITAVTTSLTTETNRATAAEGSLNTAIGTERTRALAAEGVNATAISTETSRASGIEAGIRSDLTTEVNRAKAAETNLQTNITNEQTRATGVENNLSSALTSETNRAVAAEGNVQTNLNTEKARALAAEGVLQTNINNEISNRSTADNNLSSAISTETSRASAAEGVNATAITTERNRALAAEGVNSSAISSEATRAQNAENALGTAVSSETNRAQAVEGSLQSQITNIANLFVAGYNQYGYYERRPNGVIEQWGYVSYTATSDEPQIGVNLPVALPDTAYHVGLTPVLNDGSGTKDTWVQLIRNSKTGSGFTVQYQRPGTSSSSFGLDGFEWRVLSIGGETDGNTQVNSGGGTGGGSGGGGGTLCPEAITPVLLANDTGTGPGNWTTAAQLKEGDYVWTQDETTFEWGAHRVEAVRLFSGALFNVPGYYRSTENHRLYVNGQWTKNVDLGATFSEYGIAVGITVADAHTFISLDESGNQVLNHNIKQNEFQ